MAKDIVSKTFVSKLLERSARTVQAQEKIRPCSLSQRDPHACEYWRRYDNPDIFKSQLLFPLDC